MDKKLRYTLLLVLISAVSYGQTTREKLKKIKVDHFFTCTLDQLMDTLSAAYDIPIVYERDSLMQMDITEHFFDEPLGKVIKFACSENHLQFWIENDGTIYILQQPDDLPRLKRQYELNQTARNFKPKFLAPPAHLPTHFLYTLSGRVTDQKTGEALPGANVRIRGTDLSSLTNTSGNFTILGIPSDTAVAEVSFTGYQPDVFRLDSTSIIGNVSFSLYPSLNTLNQVTVIGKKKGVLNTDSKKVSVIQLTPALLDKLPNIGEKDIMRAFQLMPGVAATNESSSGIYVRGGTPDQNLVTFDGFTIYQVDHLYGFFSAFNANAVRDVELYKGGFSSKFGGRLSSVTEVRGKDGNKKEANIGGDISLLSTNIYAETPIGTKASALVAFRRSYQGPLYSKIFGQFNTSAATGAPAGGGGGPGGGGGFGGGGGGGGFNNQTTPSTYFYDLNTKFTYAPSTQNNFTWSLYNGTDKLDNSREMTLPSFLTSSGGTLNIADKTHYGNLGTSVKWNTSPSQKLFGSTVLSYSSFFSDRDRGTTGTITDSATTTNINSGILENNKLRDFGLKSDWEWNAASKVKVLFGGFNSNVKIDYTYTQNDTTQLINQHNSGSTAGAYTEIEYDPNSSWHIQPGFRTTYFSPTGKFYYEPRLSAIYHLTDNINLKGATGRFYQFTNRVIREDVSGGDRNFWVLANSSNIPVGVSDHFILGTSYETGKYLFDVEAYYKNLNGLTEYSIRQLGGGQGGGGGGFGGGGFGGPMGGSGTTATSITENFYNGSGYAKGIEFLLQKKTGIYTGWISYTLAEAKNKFDVYGTDYFSAAQDIRHEFKSVNMYHLQRWSFAATFIFSTGHPYTAPAAVYNINSLDGNKISYLSVSTKNGERLPAYHRLDLSATYDLLKTDATKIGSISFSLFNVYNHRNTWYNEYYIRGNQVVTTTVKYLGFTPNVTLSLKLK